MMSRWSRNRCCAAYSLSLRAETRAINRTLSAPDLSMSAISTVPVAAGLAAITTDIDVLLVDVWGVLHNGIRAHAAAGEALTQFRNRGGTVVLVSNAPRSSDIVIPFLDGMGVPRSAYDGMVTSGDVARHYLQNPPAYAVLYWPAEGPFSFCRVADHGKRSAAG